MKILSPIPYFVLLPLYCLLSAWIGKATRWSNLVPAKQSGDSYYAAIDGLRGVLAISVFFHHAVVTYFYLQTGMWEAPPSNFYAQLAPFAVTMFFFITGFLFWSKLMKSQISFVPFIANRARRLGPGYLFSLGMVLVVLFIQFGLHLRVSIPALIAQLGSWLVCGIPMGFPKINDVAATDIPNARVFWSLRIEWAFYIALPFLGWFARKLRVLFLFLLCAVLIASLRWHQIIWPALDLPLGLAYYTLMCFSGGIVAAYLKANWKVDSILQHWLCTPIAAALWLTTMFAAPPKYGILESCLLAPIFLMVVFGNSFHGFLRSRALAFLGTISYSVYLMHGIVLYVCTQSVNRFISLGALPAIQYWTLIAAIGTLVIVFSSLTYRFVEYPWMVKPTQRILTPTRPKMQNNASVA